MNGHVQLTSPLREVDLQRCAHRIRHDSAGVGGVGVGTTASRG